MAQWVLSVAGIAMLSVLVDVILPDGKTRKYIKTVVGIVVTLVVSQPVINLVADGNFFVAETVDIQPQQQFIDYVEKTQGTDTERLTAAFTEAGFKGVTVVFDAKTRCYKVNLLENYSDGSYQKAAAVADAVKPNYRVKLCWNNTE